MSELYTVDLSKYGSEPAVFYTKEKLKGLSYGDFLRVIVSCPICHSAIVDNINSNKYQVVQSDKISGGYEILIKKVV